MSKLLDDPYLPPGKQYHLRKQSNGSISGAFRPSGTSNFLGKYPPSMAQTATDGNGRSFSVKQSPRGGSPFKTDKPPNVFSSYAYLSDPYDRAHELFKKEKLDNMRKTMAPGPFRENPVKAQGGVFSSPRGE